MSGKIALPSTPKLESQPLLGETESKRVITQRILKGAALGAAAWLVVTSALNSGSILVRQFVSHKSWKRSQS